MNFDVIDVYRSAVPSHVSAELDRLEQENQDLRRSLRVDSLSLKIAAAGSWYLFLSCCALALGAGPLALFGLACMISAFWSTVELLGR